MDLLAGDARVRTQGWQPQIGGGDQPVVWDTFDLVGRASSNANYMTALYNLQTFVTNAREYHKNPSREDPCWLHFQTEGGAEARALIYDGDLEMPGEGKMGALLNNAGHGVARLALARSPWWERTTAVSVSVTGVSVLGGEWAPTVASGNLDGRIGSLGVSGSSATATSTIDDIWVGIKPTYEGTASFDPIWPSDSGTLGTDAATSASGVAVSFATSSAMVERLRISVNQILGSNYTHMVGTYLVVGRLTSSAAVTSAQRFLVRTYQGLLNGTKELTGETAFNPDSTTTRLTELGYFRIPPTGYRISAGIGYPVLCASSTLYFYVQRLSGTATLTIGKIYLIPAEPIMIMKTGGLTDIADVAYFLSSPAGDTTAIVSHNSTTSYSLREHTAGPMLWPRDGGVVVLLAQKSTDSKEGFTSDLSMSVYPRYSLFRDT